MISSIYQWRFGRNLRVLRIFPMESLRHITKVFIGGIGVMFSVTIHYLKI